MKKALLSFFLLPLLALGADPFFFVHLTDTQFGMYEKNRAFKQETANFEFAVATINRLKPAFVVVTGDLVNKAGDSDQIAEYHRIARNIDPSIKFYSVAGNHDVGNEPTPESLAAYRQRFGKDYYSFQQGDMFGIVLDSSLIQHPEQAMREYEAQETWLRGELARAREANARHIVVFQHIPYFVNSPDEPDVYGNIPLERRRKYLQILREAGVRHVFAGHMHRNAGGRAGSLEVVASGPTGMPLEGGRSGIRIGIVKDSGITHRYFDFGELPNSVEPALTQPFPK